MSHILLVQGDARHIPLADRSVQTVRTSPPFWDLRDYNVSDQQLARDRLGLTALAALEQGNSVPTRATYHDLPLFATPKEPQR